MKFAAILALGYSLVFTPPKLDQAPATAKPAVVEIQLTDEVTDDNVAQLIKQIDQANTDGAKAIVMEIDSPGGSVDAGMRLAKKIERSRVPVSCIVDGDAASMASYILESCPVRAMTRRSIVMIHEPALSSEMGGQPTRWQNTADHLRYLSKAMMEHYAERMDLPVKFVLNQTYGGRSWYMSWEDAQRYHAVDIVVDSYDEFFLQK